MSLPNVITGSFQEKFCEHYGVAAERYAELVLRLTYYPHARWLVGLASDDFLGADRSFVAGVGRLTRWRDFAGEAQAFQQDSRNRGFARQKLCLRVSVARMRALFSEVWGGSLSPKSPPRSTDETGSLVTE